MPLSRSARRRAILYGGAAFVAASALALPRLIPYLVKPVKAVQFDLESAKGDESSRLLVEYLRIDTSNPPGRTREAALFWKRLFECEGLPYSIVGDDPDRPIFVGRLSGRNLGNALLLL